MASDEKHPVAWTISTDMEPAEERTFTQALREKYLADDGQECQDILMRNNFVIKMDIRGKPKDNSEGKAELGFLRNVVLNESSISRAGLSENGLKFLCPNVVDLDLSTNRLKSWREVITLFCHLPHLKYVNLAKNPLHCDQTALLDSEKVLPAIENLVLNDTHVSWKTVSIVCQRLPSIRELHICGNNYTKICEKSVPYLSNIECLRMNNNRIKSWDEIWKLSTLTKLKSLIISENPLECVYYTSQPSQDCPKWRVVNSASGGNTNSASGQDTSAAETALSSATHSERDVNTVSREGMANAASAVCQNIINEVLENVCLRRRGSSGERGGALPVQPVSQSTTTGMGDSCHNDGALGNQSSENDIPQNQDVPENAPADPAAKVAHPCDIVDNAEHGDGPSDPASASNQPENIESEANSGQLSVSQTAESSTSVPNANGEGVKEQENTQNSETLVKNGSEQSQLSSTAEAKGCTTSCEASSEAHCEASSEAHCEASCETHCEASCKTPDAGGVGEHSESACSCRVPFATLETLCISHTHISTFDDLNGLSQFPKLRSLRMKGTKMVPKVSQEDRRKILMACLPNVTILNGSEVSPSERAKNENFFLQHYKNSSNPPARFGELVEKHGCPTDLAQVDLSFCEWAEVTIMYENAPIHTFTAHMVKPLGKLRTYIAEQVLHIPRNAFRMYLYTCSAAHPQGEETTFDELFLDSLPLSRYNVMPGDEIHVELIAREDRPIFKSMRCSLERD